MARKINQAPSTQITQLATDDILYVARPSGLSDHWIKAQKFSAINPNEGDLQYFTGGNWVKTNGLLSWDGSQFTVNGVPVTVQDELVGGQAASAILQTPTVGEDGYVVSWDNTAGEFTLTPILESISLDQLSDVDVDGAADNDMLYRFGGQWVDTGGSLTWNGSIFQVTGTINATVLTTTGQIRAGSATNPNISFVDDPDTGFTGLGNVISVYNNGLVRWVFSGGGTFRSTQNKVSDLGLSTNIWNNFYSVTNWQSKQAPPASGDITGLGRTYVSNVDGLYYFRDELGNVYDLTAVGATPGGAEHELQENDGAGGFRGTKVFSSADGDLILGDSGLAGTERTISASGSETNIGLFLTPKGLGNVISSSLIGSIGNSTGNLGFSASNSGTGPAIFGAFTSGGGDPYLKLDVTGIREYVLGIDNSVTGDPLKLITETDGGTPSSGTELMVLTSDGLITWNQTLNDATGDEVAFTITPTINKLTSGNYTGLLIDVTETAAPGTDNRLIDLKVGGSTVMQVSNTGGLLVAGSTFHAGTLTKRLQLGVASSIVETSAGSTLVFNNAYFDGAYKYATTNEASSIFLNADGNIIFNTAVSGTVDTAITWVEVMRIDNSGNVGIGTISPNANAILDITSTTKAFMPPRMTTTQRDNISSPAAGMVIYNISTNVLNFHNGTSWGAV
jgi:hypothetical protein